MRLLLLIIVLSSSTLMCLAQNDAQKLLSAEQMLADITTLEENLFLTHIDIDRYHGMADIRGVFDDIKDKVKGQHLHPVDFYRELLPLLPVIANGHTLISPPSSYFDSLRYKTLRFPYDLYVDDKEVFILRDNSADRYLGEGVRLSSINGEDAYMTIIDMASKLTRDGYNTSLPLQTATESFKSYYAMFYGCPQEFKINYFDAQGKEQTYQLKGETLKDLAEIRKGRYDNIPLRWGEEGYKACDLTIEGSTAVMTINTFARKWIKKVDGRSYKQFFKEAFREIEEKGVEDLVIDLRRNGGGEPEPTIDLFSYLHPEPFVFYRSVRTKVNKIPNPKLYQGSQFFFNLVAPMRVKKQSDDLYFANGVAGLKPTEPKEEVFEGRVFVLISPSSYSATGEMASCFKQYDRVTFIGEETGGNPNVNVSGFMPNLILPHSKVQAILPIVRFEMAVDFDSDGRGVMPDHEVKASIEDMISGRDAVMEYTLRLIERESK